MKPTWIRLCGTNACVEGAKLPNGDVLLRADNTPPGEELYLTAEEWADFTRAVCDETFTL